MFLVQIHFFFGFQFCFILDLQYNVKKKFIISSIKEAI